MTAWDLLKPLLFKLDAERAHHLVVRGTAALAEMAPHLLARVSGQLTSPPPRFRPQVLGLEFASCVGLAAGLDKNAELVSALPHLGFGFCEIGTVTPRPQAGNPQPRLLRDPPSESLFNRMGFNNHGAEVIAKNLEQHKKRLPLNFRVGVNIGKNKETEGVAIAQDYRQATRPFLDLADFYVINVSSPNTPGLRALQQKDSLAPIIESVQSEVAATRRNIPILVKLAPEIGGEDLHGLLSFFENAGLSGVVLTNTLAGQTDIGPGGWSGGRVRESATQSLKLARAMTTLPIVSVGGIDSAEIAQARLDQGAALVELYSGWIFKGPRLPSDLAGTLVSK